MGSQSPSKKLLRQPSQIISPLFLNLRALPLVSKPLRRDLRDCLADYQRAVKEAKSQYLYDIISGSSHCPRMLFNTINSLANPLTSAVTNVSTTTCEKFLHFFVNNVDSVRITNKYLFVIPGHSAVFKQFELVSLSL